MRPLCWALAWTAACSPDPIDLPSSGRSYEPLASVDVAVEANLQEWQTQGRLLRGRGCTVADFDLDGRQDLLLLNPADPSYVMFNRSSPGRFSFEPGPLLDDVGFVWSASPADLDGDGDLDLFLAYGGLEGLGWDRLLRNDLVDGRVVFTDITAQAGIAGPAMRVVAEDGSSSEVPFPAASMDGQWVDYDADGDLDLWVDTTPWPQERVAPPPDGIEGRPQLWRNDGTGRFEDVAVEVGLALARSHRFAQWFDQDHDGDQDVFVNAMWAPFSSFYRNDGGRFTDVTAELSLDGGDLTMPPQSWGAAAVDLDNDGWEDLIKFVRGYATDGPYLLGHAVLMAANDRGFVDATQESNLNDPFLSGLRDHQANGVMGATVRDITGDGLPEVFLGNGGPTAGYPDGLFTPTGLETFPLGEVGEHTVPVFRNVSFLTDKGTDDTGGSGLPWPPYPYRTHAICVADLDGDGQQEALVMNGGMSWIGGEAAAEPDQLFRFLLSDTPRYLEVVLRGDGLTVPWTPYGSRISVLVERGRDRWVVRDTLRSIEGFEAHHGQVRWFGLADAERVVSVEVAWTDGTVTTVEGPELDARITVER